MTYRITIKDKETSSCESYICQKELNKLSFIDSLNGNNDLYIYTDGLELFRHDDTHTTHLCLREISYAEIESDVGKLKIPVKIVEININDDILFIVYMIESSEKEIELRKIK